MEEFKPYLVKMRRYWLAATITFSAALILGLLTYQPARTLYRVETTYLVSQKPLASTLVIEQERYYHWLVSEYIAYNLADWSQGTEFAERVQNRLASRSDIEMDVAEIAEKLSAGAIRSRLIVAFVGEDADEALLLAQAGAAELALLNDAGNLDTPQFSFAPPELRRLDRDYVIDELPPTLSGMFALPLRIALALFVGIGTMILFAYFDQTIENRWSLQPLELPVLGEIPSP